MRIESIKKRFQHLTKLPMTFYILVIDTETSGLPKNRKATPKEYKNWPNIVQIGAILYKCPFQDKPGRIIKRYSNIIRPNGWSIEPGATNVHGITEEIARNKGEDIEVVLDDIMKLSKKAHAICCHNIAFDIPVILAEYYRSGKINDPLHCPIGSLPKICTMEIGKKLCRMLTEGHRKNGDTYLYYKSPKLSELYTYLTKEEFNGTFHDALGDCEATVVILDILTRNHVPFLRITAPELFKFQVHNH